MASEQSPQPSLVLCPSAGYTLPGEHKLENSFLKFPLLLLLWREREDTKYVDICG